MDPDQTAPLCPFGNSLIRVDSVCFHMIKICLKCIHYPTFLNKTNVIKVVKVMLEIFNWPNIDVIYKNTSFPTDV